MILGKIRDMLQRMVSGLKTTQGDIIDPKFLDAGLLNYRSEIAYRNYKRDGALNEAYYQRINLIINTDLQSSAPCGSVLLTQPMLNGKQLSIPAFIKLGMNDGIQFCGSRSG